LIIASWTIQRGMAVTHRKLRLLEARRSTLAKIRLVAGGHQG
jgi:hypothetical protein